MTTAMRNLMTCAHGKVWAAALVFASATLSVGCDHIKNELLEPQNPGIIDEGAVGTAAAAAALKIGAMGKLKIIAYDNAPAAFSGSSVWEASGLLSDEFMNSDFQNSQNDVDQRSMSPDNQVSNYTRVTQARGFVRDAIVAEQTYEAQKTTDIAELYMAMSFIEMTLAENFCNGIPLGSNDKGAVDYSKPEFKPLTNAEAYAVALTHVDSALSLVGTATDSASVYVRRASLVTRARILVDQKKFTEAAALVPASAVPTTWQYLWTSSASNNNDDLGWWTLNNNIARISVSDTVVTYLSKTVHPQNVIPFASAKDPRVPVLDGAGAKLVAEDLATPLFIQQIWKGRDDPIAMVAGVDARLIEAEERLNADDIPGMMTILNALRAAPPRLSVIQPAAMTPLAAPATKDEAISLFFREKAFWTFGRGQRLSDMRRLVRQYGRTQDKVYPVGEHYKGGVYGSDVNLPVPDAERVNPQFKGCLDRNA